MSSQSDLGALLSFRPDPEGWIGSWSPGIGDPTVWGWITVLVYLAAAWKSYQLARSDSLALPSQERRTWWILAVCLLFLGVNKQLDLQTALTEMGRVIARAEGWYERRRAIQAAFIAGFSVVAAAVSAALLAVTRRLPRATRVAVLGAVLVIAFVVIRATSFHKMDRFIGVELRGARTNWVVELGGLSVILAGACWRGRRPDRRAVPRGSR